MWNWRSLDAGWCRKNISLIAGVLVVACELSSCQMGSASANGGGPPPLVPSAIVSFCDDGNPSCTPGTSFSVATLRDLVIKVTWEHVPDGNHVQTLEIMMPGGGLYQSTQTAFLTDSTSAHSLATTRLLPVAGTWIPQRQITGDWLVRVSLDGQVITSQMVAFNP
ncbi:MAG: hypothetical protein ACRD5M_13800 [Candidatus Acidiferrales bacterium]